MKRLQEKVENFESLITKQKEESREEVVTNIMKFNRNLMKWQVKWKICKKKLIKFYKMQIHKSTPALRNKSQIIQKQLQNNELKIRSTEVENMHKGLVEVKVQYDDMQVKGKRRNQIILYRSQECTAPPNISASYNRLHDDMN